jgi:hypothetical protein
VIRETTLTLSGHRVHVWWRPVRGRPVILVAADPELTPITDRDDLRQIRRALALSPPPSLPRLLDGP